MKRIYTFIIPGLLALSFICIAWVSKTKNSEGAKIDWVTIEEAQKRAKKNPKKIFVDIYTDWCGWCKRMDRATFQNPEVAEYMNEHYYSVKMNAEAAGAYTWKGQEYGRIQGSKTNKLARALMGKSTGYPTVTFIDENLDILSPLPGYQPPERFMVYASFFAEEHYKTMKFEEYQAQYKAK